MPSPPFDDRQIQPSLFDYVGDLPQQFLSPLEMFSALTESNLRRWKKETSRVECKSVKFAPRDLGEYFSMWANTGPDGGLIFIGIESDGAIAGCLEVGEDKHNALETVGPDYCPDARFQFKRIPVHRDRDGKLDFVLAFHVDYHETRVVSTSNKQVFRRYGDQKRVLGPEQVRELKIEKGELDLEREPASLTYPSEFRMDLIFAFCDAVKRRKTWSQDHSTDKVLELLKLGRIQDGKFVPNIACALLFANDVRDIIPGCRVRFLRFDGTQERSGPTWNAIKDEWIDGNVPELIVRTAEVVRAQLRTFSRMEHSGKFFSSPEYPEFAWYEAIVNAVAHRSYGNGLKNSHIFVKMFDDRLVVESPGPFMPFVDPVNIYDQQRSRNPYLMDALYYLDYVKAANEGTKRMKAEMEMSDLPAPEFRQDGASNAKVVVTLRNRVNQRRQWVDFDIAQHVGQELIQSLTEDQKQIFNFLAVNRQINVSEASRMLGKRWHTARKILDNLVQRGLLHRESEGHRDSKSFYHLKPVLPDLNS